MSTVPNQSAFGALETTANLTPEQIKAAAGELLAQLSLEEKIGLMSGDPSFWEGLVEMNGGGYSRYVHKASPATWPSKQPCARQSRAS